VIIPGQRAMVRAMEQGREPDPQYGIRGKLRSTHNTYFTLPVLFTMISNHYAITYNAAYNWLVLLAVCAAGALIRVYFVARHKAHERDGRTSPWPAILGVLMLTAVAFALAPARSRQTESAADSPAEQFKRVQAIVAQRCVSCHASTPTQPGFTAAPGGVMLDSPDRILLYVAKIQQQVATRAMPVGNITGLTEEERAAMLAWIERGAPH